MKINVETHCHTIASTHAYNTFLELVNYAKKLSLDAIAITDHGPALPDGAHQWHFGSLGLIPQTVDGILIIKGAEVNIINYDGEVDLDEYYLKRLQLVIASMHEPVLAPSSDINESTRAWLAIAENPFIDVIGHSGNEHYKYDYEKVIPEFRKNNKAVELNNHSFECRLGAPENCTEIARLCKKYGCKVVLGSDAHICYDLCRLDNVLKLLDDIDFPEELIMNRTVDVLTNWLSEKKGIKFK